MRKLTWVRVLAVVMVPALFACGGTGKKDQDVVLAVVNGDRITESMFRKEAEGLPPYIRPIVDTPAGRMQFLDSLIARDLLMREALRRGVERRAEVRDRLEQARRSILLEALFREVAENARVQSDEVLRRYYEENKATLETGERIRVRHILFKEEGKAEETARRARKGEPFDQLMKDAEVSGGTMADLGMIERGAYDKEFEDAAFAAPENSITGPVKTLYGYHVIQVMEKRPAGLPPFEEVKGKIAVELREGAQREAFDNLLNGLKKQAKIRLAVSPPAGAEAPFRGANPSQGGR
jgi:peptidyl-prolyl cis-trans isomerase C